MATTELDHVKAVWQRQQGNSPIYDFLLSDVDIVSATRGTFVARLVLKKNHVNSRGTIHGAVSAALVDWSGGMAIATHGLEKTGASIDIHVTYVSTAQVDDTIQIEATANKVGRSIGFTSVKISKLVDGSPGPIVATASHTKYLNLTKPPNVPAPK